MEQTKPAGQVKPVEQAKPTEQVKPVIHVKPNSTTTSTASGNVSMLPNMLQSASTNVTPSVSPAANMGMQPMNAPSGPTYGMAAVPNPNLAATGGANPAFTAASMPNPNLAAAGGANPAFTAASMPNPNLAAAGGANPAFTAASTPNPNLAAAGGANPAFTASSIPNYMPNLPVYPNPMPVAQQSSFPPATANVNAHIKPMGTDQPLPLPMPIEEAAKNPYRYYEPFIGPYDPCPPITVKRYVVPINQYLNFQPAGLPQFAPAEALKRGTLWPLLSSPYEPEF